MRYLLLSLALLAGTANAETTGGTPKPTSIMHLFVLAVAIGGYYDECQQRKNTEDACTPPNIILSNLNQHGLKGYFTPSKPDQVWIDRVALMPGTLAWNSVVIHEFTHWLQWRTGKMAPEKLAKGNCSHRVAIESEAYKVQYEYLDTQGYPNAKKEMEARINYTKWDCAVLNKPGE